MNIRIEHVTFTYPTGVTALDDVDLSIASGEALALVGENGAGKTTLAKHLNGLLRPGQGRVLLNGEDARSVTIAQLARHVAYVFQNPDEQLFERTVRAEVAFGPRNLGYGMDDVSARVAAALELTGLASEAECHPYDLQPYQRKMVTLAAALSMGTPALVVDEPTTGQDAMGVARIGDIIETLKASGRTLVAISHDLDFCAEHFDRMVVMSHGHIVAQGQTEEILAQSELLAQAGIDPPQLVRLAAALELGAAPRSIEAFVSTWSQREAKGPPPW